LTLKPRAYWKHSDWLWHQCVRSSKNHHYRTVRTVCRVSNVCSINNIPICANDKQWVVFLTSWNIYLQMSSKIKIWFKILILVTLYFNTNEPYGNDKKYVLSKSVLTINKKHININYNLRYKSVVYVS